MYKHFISLQWKSFFRSASLGKSIALKILMAFLAIYFAVAFLVMGVALYPGLKKVFPDQDPVVLVNRLVLLWLAAELVIRFFMQTLPVISIKPLLINNVPKKKVVHFVLLKSFVSFFNLLDLLIIIPFAVFAAKEGDYGALNMAAWAFAMICLVYATNYANFLIKKKFADNLKAFLPFIIVAVVLIVLEYLDIFRITAFTGKMLNALIIQPYLAIIPLLIVVGLYVWNFNVLNSRFYLDASLKTKTKEAETTDLSWTRRFGEIAPFLQLDLKLIWRNKRPKTTIWLSLVLLGYGLIFYPQETYQGMPAFFVFVGIFMTGIFMINFGQFIPSWDSGYYSMMMSQNIPLRKYLASKAGLITFSVVVLFLLSIPYVYFGWNILALNVACALYNIGVNIPVLLFAGSFNKKKIDLEKSPFMNYQGTGATQWLVSLPLMLLPLLIWYGVYKLIGFDAATIVLGVLGIIGIALRGYFMNIIAGYYRKNKYSMIAGFKQEGE
ncbi:DUF5687 family protein [Gangjinia marincola]|uniref:DUF5687 family protein n=1 Tax=Gangjinia marincola TaxID=578463 RepID=A0ABP3XWJ6_9FLAO